MLYPIKKISVARSLLGQFQGNQSGQYVGNQMGQNVGNRAVGNQNGYVAAPVVGNYGNVNQVKCYNC